MKMNYILFTVFMCFFTTSSFAYLSPPQRIEIVPPDNSIADTGPCKNTSPDYSQCLKRNTKTWILNLYESPDFKSKKLGIISMIIENGNIKSSDFIDVDKKVTRIATGTEGNHMDYSYPSPFETTVSNIKDDWIQLPQRPFPKPVWINFAKDWPQRGSNKRHNVPRYFETDILTVPTLGNIVILRYLKDQFVYRKENAEDMPCGDEEVKVHPSELKEFTAPMSLLFDKDGHFLNQIAYPRGC